MAIKYINSQAGLDAINAEFVTQSNLLTDNLYKQQIRDSVWSSGFIDQLEWKDGVGGTGRRVIYDPAMLDGQLAWKPWDENTYSPDAEFAVLETGATEIPFRLWRTGITSMNIDIENIRFSHNPKDQVVNIIDQFTKTVGYQWGRWYQDAFSINAAYKVVVTNTASGGLLGIGFTGDDTTMPEVEPTGVLTAGIMDRMHTILTRERAFDTAEGIANGKPLYLAFASPEVIDYVLREDENIRQDFRWSNSRVGELFDLWGVRKAYRGFIYMEDTFAPRWKFDNALPAGQKWVRVEPYIAQATTHKDRYLPNPEYDQAKYVDTIIFNRGVYDAMIPKPITSVGPAKFNAQNYRGTIDWVNIRDRHNNPRGTIGNFWATMACAIAPKWRRRGAVIRHLLAFADADILDIDRNKIGSVNPQAAGTLSGQVDPMSAEL